MVSYLFNDRNFEALEHAIQVMSFGHVTSNQFDTRWIDNHTVGTQHLRVWTGANVVRICPAEEGVGLDQ
jgi:hypothetical protein